MTKWKKRDSDLKKIWSELEINLAKLVVNLQEMKRHTFEAAELAAAIKAGTSCPSVSVTTESSTTSELDHLLRSMDYRSLLTLDTQGEEKIEITWSQLKEAFEDVINIPGFSFPRDLLVRLGKNLGFKS